jgi:hypothetical protein
MGGLFSDLTITERTLSIHGLREANQVLKGRFKSLVAFLLKQLPMERSILN